MPNNTNGNILGLAEFKAELCELLKKYNATLGVNIEGDTHGLMYDFTVELNNKDYVLSDGNRYIDASDLDKVANLISENKKCRCII